MTVNKTTFFENRYEISAIPIFFFIAFNHNGTILINHLFCHRDKGKTERTELSATSYIPA